MTFDAQFEFAVGEEFGDATDFIRGAGRSRA
jgi:hypothetical protein